MKREPPHTPSSPHYRRTSSASSPIHNSTTTRGRIQPFNSLTNNSRSTGILLFEPDRQVSRTDTQSRHTHVVRRPFHPFASLFILLKLDLFSRDVRLMKREPGSRIVSVKRRIYRSQCGSPRVAVRSFPHILNIHDAHFNNKAPASTDICFRAGSSATQTSLTDTSDFVVSFRHSVSHPPSTFDSLSLSLLLSLTLERLYRPRARTNRIHRPVFFLLSLSSLLFDRPFELSRQDPSHDTLGEKDSPE